MLSPSTSGWQVPSVFFLFIQAEDGIRDLYVTGVQTCALPIFDTERLMAEQQQKRQMKQLFEKIQAMIADVAKREGYDLVLAESNDQLPTDNELDQMNIQQFKVMLLQ